ncbi:MAG: hypothetical protein IJ610_11720, partial [Bacteroidaceae bacterium]|nr:hypothetical protein [Bacteroidaceae bacterium]
DAQIGVLEFAHILVLLFNSLDCYLLACKHIVNHPVQFVPVLVDSLDNQGFLVGCEFRPSDV